MFLYTLDHIGGNKVAVAFRRAGLKFSAFHGFRRGLATLLFEEGCDDLTVMRVLRHASVQVTRASYIKVRDNVLEAAMAKITAKQSASGLRSGSPEPGSC